MDFLVNFWKQRTLRNWVIIVIVTLIALLNPLYLQFWAKDAPLPVVTLGLDLRGGVEVLLKAELDQARQGVEDIPNEQRMQGVMEIVRNRVDPQGTKEISLTMVGTDRLNLQVPGEENPDAILQVIGETALLEFVNTGDQSFEPGTDFNKPGSDERKAEYAKYETVLTGAELKRAYPTFGQRSSGPIIGFEFTKQAADTFGQFTANHVGQYLTVLLDGKVLTSPKINSAIWGGQGVIEGQFTPDHVDKIVRQLNAGALPVPLTPLSSSVVGPTLGQQSINDSIIAGLIGFAIVLLYILLFYRLPGVVAAVALTLYVVLVTGYFSLINATLTLPGIAGFLLSIGMAIDGNIIIFERLKEELRWGKTLNAAVEAAFNRAWVAIFDGNVTTLIGAAVLYFYGTGPVKGFAVTLSIGIILSVFSAVFVSRNIMTILVRNIRSEKLYG